MNFDSVGTGLSQHYQELSLYRFYLPCSCFISTAKLCPLSSPVSFPTAVSHKARREEKPRTHCFPATNKKHLLNYVFHYKEEKLDLIVLNMLLSPRFYLLLFAIIPSGFQYITEREREKLYNI